VDFVYSVHIGYLVNLVCTAVCRFWLRYPGFC